MWQKKLNKKRFRLKALEKNNMFSGQDRNRPKSRLRLNKRVRFAILVVFLTIACATLVTSTYVVSLFWRAEKFDIARVTQQGDESMLYDANNQLMGTLSGDVHRQVQFEDLPLHLVNALLAREDEHFFEHGGVQYLSIVRSFLRNVRSMRYAQGASTISMQLTRNVFELRDKSIDRKALEIVLTYLVESRYDKKTIMSQYLNRIYFGENCYGIGDAANHYFSKDVKDLNLNESATLIGLVRGPSIFNPVKSMPSAINVRNETLDRMVLAEMISEQEAAQTKNEPINLNISAVSARVSTYPLMAVRREMSLIDADLADETASIAVVSKVNKQIQTYTESALETCLSFMEGNSKPDERWLSFIEESEQDKVLKSWNQVKRAKNMPTRERNGLDEGLQGVVLVVDSRLNSKGDVLAYMAGRDASDYQDRWQNCVKVGNALAPLIFCSAMTDGKGSVPIVANSAEVTARKVGYDQLSQYIGQLELFENLPPSSDAADLYKGNFDISLYHLARLYYCLLHHGIAHEWNFLQAIYSQNRHLLYAHAAKEFPELIRRESARIVSTLPPFEISDGSITILNESLPDGMGQWCVVTNNRGVTVFAWVGYDCCSAAMKKDENLSKMLSQFPLLMARQIHAESRRVLVADQNRRKEEAKARKEAAGK